MGIMWTCAVILMLMGGNQVFAGTLTKGELVSMLTYTNQVVGSRFNGCNDHHDAHHDARIRDAHQRGA